jgi:4-amino-4-deoxy-L-arabinose transferase-like glycosyltransferase
MIEKLICTLKNLKEKQLIVLLLGIAFGLRLYAVLMAKGIAMDSAGYGFMARDFLKGDFAQGLSWALHPLYPLLISLIAPDSTHVEIAGRLISLLWGTFTLIPLYYLVKGAIGQKEAAFTALFYTFHPYLVTYSGMLLSEATYWGLLVLSVYFFWTGLKRENVWRMALSGSFLGLAYLTRPEGIGYVLVYLGWIVVEGVLTKKWFKKGVLAGIMILGAFIFVIPYVIRIHQETDQWLISRKAVGVQAQFSKKGVDEADSSKGVEQEKPGESNSTILVTTKNVVQHLPFVIYRYLMAYHFSLWLFLLFGLIRVRQKIIPYELFIASLVLFHLLSLSTFTPSFLRFSVPVIPLALFWAGAGVFEIKRRLGKFSTLRPEEGVFWLIVLALLIQLPQSFMPERSHRAYQKEMGLWLKKNTTKNAIIMSNSPIEAFYADREFIPLPSGIPTAEGPGKSYEEIINYAKQRGVLFILINQNTHEPNPDFIPSIKGPDLEEFYRYQKDERHFIIIYEVIYRNF